MDYQHIKVERGGEIATVTFNRPEKANALNYRHLEEIEHAALSFRDDEEARVVIFTGAGKHFNSGADLTGKLPRHPRLTVHRRNTRMGQRCIQSLLDMDQITIAAWNGAAMGGGACIATALDFRIGGRDCFMSYPEILIGVNLMWQSLPLCMHLVGPARAKQLVIGGKHIPGPTLLDWGALDEMVEADQVMDKAMEIAGKLAAKSPVVMKLGRDAYMRAVDTEYRRDVENMAEAMRNVVATDDSREGLAAFMEKRPPKWQND